MTESTTTETVRIEVFLRTQTPVSVVERLRELVARARRLEGSGAITDVQVKTWAPIQPALEELSDSGLSVSLTVNAFQAWAERQGYTLRPAFARRETASLLSCQPVVELQVPTICVAVYKDDTLQCVAPCTDDKQTYTVEECLTALEAGITDPFAGQEGQSQIGPELALTDEPDQAE